VALPHAFVISVIYFLNFGSSFANPLQFFIVALHALFTAPT